MKFRDRLVRFMQGRYGPDQLGRFSLFAALGLYVLSLFPHCWFLNYVGLALLIWTMWRMFSRNTTRRYQENARYLAWTGKFRKGFSQARVRFKNRREYKYFRCPKCRSWLKPKRGAGEGTMTCGNCNHQFHAKA